MNVSAPATTLAPHWLVVALLTALVYVLFGVAALWLAGLSSYAVPFYPAAGIALAVVLTYGRSAWLGVWIGAWAVNTLLSLVRGAPSFAVTVLPLVIGLGALAQAVVGAALIRWRIGRPLELSAPNDVAWAGLLGAGVACLVNPSVATLALWGVGKVEPGQMAATWFTWWAGDALGVMIAAPLALAFIGQPAEAWRRRRLPLGATLAAALALLASAMWAIERGEQQQLQLQFELEADRLAASTQWRLQAPLHALQGLHAAVRASGRADAATLRAATQTWIHPSSAVVAMGFSERVAAAEVPALEAAARAEGMADFRVYQRDGGRALAADGEAVVLRRIEPAAGNAAALGVNALSIPAARMLSWR